MYFTYYSILGYSRKHPQIINPLPPPPPLDFIIHLLYYYNHNDIKVFLHSRNILHAERVDLFWSDPLL